MQEHAPRHFKKPEIRQPQRSGPRRTGRSHGGPTGLREHGAPARARAAASDRTAQIEYLAALHVPPVGACWTAM